MPIKSLETYLFERGLVRSYPIEALKNATLGIDVNHYISRLLTNKREQFLDAIGGMPTSLKLYLESDLKIFEEYNITPVFVFNGSMISNQKDTSGVYPSSNGNTGGNSNLNLNSNTSNNSGTNVDPLGSQGPKTVRDSVLSQRHRAWTLWNNLLASNQQTYIDQPIQPQEPFRFNTAIDTTRFYGDLIKYFIENGIIYQVAPFVSWCQLAYLLRNEYIDAIYGPTDCLMLKSTTKFILGMEFPNKEFRFIDKSKILKEFNCTHDEFVDISMAVGNSLQPTTLPPLQIYPIHQLFDVALEMVLSSATNFYAYQLSNPLKNESSVYIEKYQKGHASLRFMPVLKDSGKVEVFIDEQSKTKNNDENNNNINNPSSNLNANQSITSSSSTNNPSINTNSSNPNSSPNDNKVTTSSNATNSSSTATNSNKLTPQEQESIDVTSLGEFNQIPNDVHDFIAQKLPHEYYFYKSIGIIDGRLLDVITTGFYPEESPLDGGSTNSYRSLVKLSVDAFKNFEINLLTQSINRYYQIKPIKQIKWFAPEDPVLLTNRITPSVFDTINHLVVKTGSNQNKNTVGDDATKEGKESNSNDETSNDQKFQLSSLINILASSKDLAKDFISDDVLFSKKVPDENKLSSPFDLLSTNYLRTLYLLEFLEFDFSKRILKPTKWGEILLKLNDLNISEKYFEPILILLVFLKLNVLNLSDDTQPSIPSALSQVTLRSYPLESSYILLITRILTLFQIEQKPSHYHGPIDKKTLVFRDHLDFVKVNLKELYEAVTIASLTSGEFLRLNMDDNAWRNKIVGDLPFKSSSPNTIMAMMWEFFLQKFLHNGNAKNDALTLVTTEFNTYRSTPNLEGQFKNSLEFLEQVSSVFNELLKVGLVTENNTKLLSNAVEFARTVLESN
ncbi:hypothetical protein TBLA_0E03600 [Henningerozyma blattae CBS 6284]|uniref:XPG N-terminal domain-containing protein n=1 Tax=Henningerozyma blattae (strain ATCC 34711 / CBS 6284 / DSM 70876 / NBRC 10599 / NRRL Y-10934 / UCD 77-7) TaxID=1071380 RepID=I2H4W2_HENB6|nr:hypothetical protein TBLA_0E03600 [Tetrapisispora blattae CBS 6284]CCH61414.1 hypothetical protein TBLA_0E03600 [Tetrapisispora blattae CBS 6284]